MELQTTADTFRARFAFPLDRLKSVLREWGVSSGSLADIEPFAERLQTPGAFAEAMAATLRAFMHTEGTAPTRMELLELLCMAVSGTDVEGSGPALRRPLREMLVFINGVLLSMQEAPVDTARGKASIRPAELENGKAAASVNGVAADWPAEAPEEGSAIPETDEATGPDFYILENFGQFAHAGSLATAPARAPLEPTKSPQPISPLSVVSPAVRPRTLAPHEDSLEALSGERFEHSVSAMTSLASTMLNRTVPDAVRLDAQPVTDLRNIQTSVEANEETADDAGERAKGVRFLSQPALLACAVVVSFAAGMLVPRYKPQKASAPAGSAPADRSRSNAAAPAPVEAAQTALPLPSPPSSLPQPAPVAGQSPGVDPRVPATAFLKAGSGTVATIPANTALQNLIYSPPPQYPSLARLAHAEGDVNLAIVVSPQGAVVGTHVLGGQPLLRGAAENAVQHWRFRPFVVNGKPAQIQTAVVVDVRPASATRVLGSEIP